MCTHVAAVTAGSSGVHVYQPGAKVRYSFSFNTGVKDFPPGSQLTLMTTPEVIAQDSFHCSTTADQPSITDGISINSTALISNTTYNCHFDVETDSSYQTQGRFPDFTIKLSPSDNLTDAYHIPSLHTEEHVDVLVYTGASLSYTSYLVVTQAISRKTAATKLWWPGQL